MAQFSDQETTGLDEDGLPSVLPNCGESERTLTYAQAVALINSKKLSQTLAFQTFKYTNAWKELHGAFDKNVTSLVTSQNNVVRKELLRDMSIILKLWLLRLTQLQEFVAREDERTQEVHNILKNL